MPIPVDAAPAADLPVLSDLARQAMTQEPDSASSQRELYGFEPFEHRGPAVSNALVDRLRDDEAV